MVSDAPILHYSNNTTKEKINDEDIYCTVCAFKANFLPSLIPDKFSMMWGTRLKTEINTLETTIYQCIRYTGLLAKWFKADKYKLKYKQLSCQYNTFYVDYLKLRFKSVRQFIGVNFYITNSTGLGMGVITHLRGTGNGGGG